MVEQFLAFASSFLLELRYAVDVEPLVGEGGGRHLSYILIVGNDDEMF